MGCWWKSDSRVIEGAATYSWSEQDVDQIPTVSARVGDAFFPLFGARSFEGRSISGDSLRGCPNCVVLAYDFWRRAYHGKIPETVAIRGRRMRVAGILDKRFWFLTHRIGIWES